MFFNGHQRSIYMWLGTRICSEFFRTKKVLSSQKQNYLIPLKIPWPIHLQFNKELFWVLYCSIYSREISSSLHLISKKGLRDQRSLVVKQFEHKGRVALVWFRTCKRLLQDSGTLERVVWGLDVGTRVWSNQYKSEFAFSLPLNSFIYYCLLLLFSKSNLHNYLGIHFERNLGFWVKIKIEFLIRKKFVIS